MRNTGRQLGAIALLALLVRAIVPLGYMLASADTPQGRYLIVQLCDGHAAAALAIDLDSGEQIALKDIQKPDSPEKKPETAPCVFAGAPHLAAPISVVDPISIFETTQLDFANVEAIRPGRGIAAPPPPSTGPPALI